MSEPDIAFFLEGTYPYVAGGVSSWVHQLLNAYPERTFSLLHIGPHPGAYRKPVYDIPDNVVSLEQVFCVGTETDRKRWRPRYAELTRRRTPSRTLAAFRRLHLEERVDDLLVADLAANDLTIDELLHGEEVFELLRNELYPRLGDGAPFMDFFWHFRAMHIPLLRLLSVRTPDARAYHALSTGYAGLCAAVASERTRRPLVVTEHGIYAREREIELARAPWISDTGTPGIAGPSPLRGFWAHYFKMLARIAYHRATHVLTLSEVNRGRQLADGADPAKIAIIPNGVDQSRFRCAPRTGEDDGRPMRVGFVGRVVPIKDVNTLIRACSLALEQVDLEVWIIGPEDEEPLYAQRCHTLVELMGLQGKIKFLGPRPMPELYPQLDVVALTSVSEGQPLVILEAYANELPVVATDVGACRELIEGGAEDARLGPSGIVTRVANPTETAAALMYLAHNPEDRRAMGRAGLQRVGARYQQDRVVAHYDALYANMVSPSLA